MDDCSRAGVSCLTTSINGMSHSPSISSVTSSYTSHSSKLNRETINKIGIDNLLYMINSAGKIKSNDIIDNKDTDEEFTLVVNVNTY